MQVIQIKSKLILAFTCLGGLLHSQQNIGINTTTPQRSLDVRGSGDEYVRVSTSNTTTAESTLELILGGNDSPARDYKITNDGGIFKILTATDNFLTSGEELWRINELGEIGIGTNVPTSRLHINNGEEASNDLDGCMIVGTKASTNLVFDPNEIIARNNGASNSITLQSHDGVTHIGLDGGHTFIGDATGNLGIGTSSPNARLSLVDDDFQLNLVNNDGSLNDWHIGASSDSWISGDNQLLFSPDATSDAAVLRLLDVTDNNGTVAPVMIRSGANQTLLLDGNEIESKSGPLYINHNSNQETYINPSGGRVGMGNDEPSTTLHVTTQDDEYALRLQKDNIAWDLNPLPAFDYLGFVKGGWTLAHVDGNSGQWITISDRRLKENIELIPPVLDKIKRVNTYTYSFKHIAEHTRQIGIIAQELLKEWPELVHVHEGHHTVAYSKLSVILIKALQEQQKEIDALQKEIVDLTALQTK